ncbi:MAG: rhodanese-like domain-containing protein [Candidatus Nanopelagicales bacterium]
MGLFSALRTPSVHADEVADLLARGGTMLDVRESAEWNAGHAPHAVHVPLGRLADAPRRLKEGAPVVVVCRSGNRSRGATSRLRQMGYEAYNLKGGMRAWARDGGRLVDRRNRPGAVV